MSADKTTVAEYIEQLKQMPQDMLVIGRAIWGYEGVDGVNKPYTMYVNEGSDGFTPLDKSRFTPIEWKRMKKDVKKDGWAEIRGFFHVTKVVVVSPYNRENFIKWEFANKEGELDGPIDHCRIIDGRYKKIEVPEPPGWNYDLSEAKVTMVLHVTLVGRPNEGYHARWRGGAWIPLHEEYGPAFVAPIERWKEVK